MPPVKGTAPSVDPGRLSVSDNDIRATVATRRAFSDGQHYFRTNRTRILGVEDGPDGLEVRAETRGSAPHPYEQSVALRRGARGRVEIEGDCTCPMQYNCKHVASALMQWRAEGEHSTSPVVQLPHELHDWLSQLEGVAGRIGETYPPGQRQRLIYVVRPATDRSGLIVMPMSVRLDKDGVRRAASNFDASSARSHTAAKFLRASDLYILNRVAERPIYGFGVGRGVYSLEGTQGAALLGDILATGRAVWTELDGPAMSAGPALPGRGAWDVGSDGVQSFRLSVDDAPEAVVLALAPPYYVDSASGRVGRIIVDLPNVLVLGLLQGPRVAPALANQVAVRLEKALGPAADPGLVPRQMPVGKTVHPDARPRLRLTTTGGTNVLTHLAGGGYAVRFGEPQPALPIAVLSFDYDGCEFHLGEGGKSAAWFDGQALMRVVRKPEAETAAAELLASFGLESLTRRHGSRSWPDQAGVLTFGSTWDTTPFVDFLIDVAPRLEAQGWRIDIDPGFPVKLARADDDTVSFDASTVAGEGSGVDWFDLKLGVRIDGAQVDILPALTSMLRHLPEGGGPAYLETLANEPASKRVLLALGDGRSLPLPLDRLLPILQGLFAVWGPEDLDGSSRPSRRPATDLAVLQEAVGDQIIWSGDRKLLALAGELRGWRDRQPTPLPDGFAATLRPYQQTGLDWLQMLRRTGLGGLLADDMGLGKTVQTLAHLAVEKAAGRLQAPALVVAPTSVLGNWRAEGERFAPQLRCLVLRGADRAESFAEIARSDLVITSYPLLVRDQETLLGHDYSVVVFDEAQSIRNPVTAAAKVARAVNAAQRIALSGTPVENHLLDLWSLMQAINPGLLGDSKSFAKAFRTPIEKHGDAAAKARLARRVRPFLLRRTKDEAAPELPEKVEIEERLELASGQSELYEATRLAMQVRVREALASKGLARSAIVVLDALLKLRQVCCDPRLVKTAKAKPAGSAKLARLMELVEELRTEGRRALIFSQFTSMLELIRAELDARGLSHVWLTGDTIDRTTPVQRFQAGEVDLFLISLKAGGAGLNLTAADAVILYDPWWNPAVEAQAIGRAHRIGRAGTVFVHRLIAEDTIEVKMLALQAGKRDLAALLWEGEGSGLAGMTEADVRGLFD